MRQDLRCTWNDSSVLILQHSSCTQKGKKEEGSEFPQSFQNPPVHEPLLVLWWWNETSLQTLSHRILCINTTQKTLLIFSLKTRSFWGFFFFFHDITISKSKTLVPRIWCLYFRVESSESLILAHYSGDRTKKKRDPADSLKLLWQLKHKLYLHTDCVSPIPP